ncbi:MAG: phytoene desaturase family protein [Bacteroidota bacterium]
MEKRKVIVIGAGFSGITTATMLAREGYDVEVFEKNIKPGGRATQLEEQGYVFDKGPSWYWLPDVFEDYFGRLGKRPEDYYSLQRLDPSYRVYFGKDNAVDVPASHKALFELFESIEPGSAAKLEKLLREAEYKYRVGMKEFVYKPSLSVTEFFDWRILKSLFRMGMFQSIHKYVRKYFSDPRLIQILEFPILFLGAAPKDTPSLYTLMNHADLTLGTWYPDGGFYAVIKGMETLATEQGVTFHYNAPVESISVSNGKVDSVVVNSEKQKADVVVGSADYHHVEQQLLPEKYRSYSKKYWNKRNMAPSALLFFMGFDKEIKNLLHHNLLFDEDFDNHAFAIYEQPHWPEKPLLYVSATSKTDNHVAPEGHENVVVLIPVAPGIDGSKHIRDDYQDLVLSRIESLTGDKIKDHLVYSRSYAHEEFHGEYNAFKGNAYGLSNTLGQTAILKPSIVHKKLPNMFYTGQLTTPGPGVPPVIISGQVVAKQIIKRFPL